MKLDRFWPSETFDVTVTGSDVSNHKPHPDAYGLGIERLGIDPGKIFVVEDNPSGVMSARKAGCGGIIAYPNGFTADTEKFYFGHADAIITSLDDIDDEMLRDLYQDNQ